MGYDFSGGVVEIGGVHAVLRPSGKLEHWRISSISECERRTRCMLAKSAPVRGCVYARHGYQHCGTGSVSSVGTPSASHRPDTYKPDNSDLRRKRRNRESCNSICKTVRMHRIVDYRSSDAIQQIRDLVTKTGLSLILDCVANDDIASSATTAQYSESVYGSLRPVPNLSVKADLLPTSSTILSAWSFVYTCYRRRFTLMGKTSEPSVEDKTFMTASIVNLKT
ncbi:hypothetical protein N7508_006454 [Penicillium antarcticum]|uniref:uncharacterized protein n=1 Tax=Penicillium antarcticum TaxID=416450 RepID=UPI002395AC83|nr:uncharacterized protein N7508_006454 [Penicillium antarcticum]KAJ5301591.1 hypothetical protein N7508_006454 [Penicillium antarcticum]